MCNQVCISPTFGYEHVAKIISEMFLYTLNLCEFHPHICLTQSTYEFCTLQKTLERHIGIIPIHGL